MAELVLAKQDSEVLEDIIWTQRRNADHECMLQHKKEEDWGRWNCQLPICMSLGCWDGMDQSEPLSCLLPNEILE